MSLAKGGSPLGPMFYIIAYGIIGPTISYIAFHSGYRLGVNAIDVIVGENSKRITDAFNILGIMVVGALAANTIVLKTIAKIPLGGKSAPLENVLTGIFPDLLPLAMVMFAWWLISAKQMSATKVILIITAIVTVGCLVGFF
jgi:mannose/fructose/N-acetylgalactosamine-specific phosphotransferase system component IID